MKLKGSCHCGKIKFSLESPHPYPFNYCYCSICRKTQGGGGYAINLGGDYHSLKIEGEENISVYQVMMTDAETGDTKQSPARRHFCRYCSSNLWVWDPRWPDLVHPFASAIDTQLAVPPQRTHLMLSSKSSWVAVENHGKDQLFNEYPDESLAQWHQRMGLD